MQENLLKIEFFPAIPEIFLAFAALVFLLLGAFRGDAATRVLTKLVIAAFLLSILLLSRIWNDDLAAFGGFFISNSYTVFVKIALALATSLVLLTTLSFTRESKKHPFEFPILILLATIGMMVMVSANDLISLYIGLEMQSLSLYVLASFDRTSPRSSEAGVKYFVLGALSSGLLLYGCSLIYGFTGTTQLSTLMHIFQTAPEESVVPGIIVGLVLVMTALFFKISAVPFHMWTPDVYEGAPTKVTAFFASAPKVAAIALFVRIMMEPFGGLSDQWQQIVILVAILSMLLGAIAALKQTNIKRLMAYSSIGHVGYLLVGVATGTMGGVHAALIYIAIYMLMSIGTFACILHMRRQDEAVEHIMDLAGVSKTHPVFALAMTIFMLSMAGIPPLAGFFGKFFVFKAALESGLYALAIIGVLTSVIAAFYYLRIIKIMYFDEVSDPLDVALPQESKAVLFITAAFNALFFLYPIPLLRAAEKAVTALLS